MDIIFLQIRPFSQIISIMLLVVLYQIKLFVVIWYVNNTFVLWLKICKKNYVIELGVGD